MYSRNKILFKRPQKVETPTGSKDGGLVDLFSAFAEIKAYSTKEMQRLSIDLKNTNYTIIIRYSKDRILKLGDRIETQFGQLVLITWDIDDMGKQKTIKITASKNGI